MSGSMNRFTTWACGQVNATGISPRPIRERQAALEFLTSHVKLSSPTRVDRPIIFVVRLIIIVPTAAPEIVALWIDHVIAAWGSHMTVSEQ